MSRSATVTQSLTGVDLDSPPLYEVKDIPGKGRGLIARFDIPLGTRVLCEKPLFTAPSSIPNDVWELFLAAQLKALPKESLRQFLSLHNNHPEERPFSGMFRTNALPCGPGPTPGAVYPTLCLINHSCVPNCYHNWNGYAGHETIHAIRPIKSGEEITIRYWEDREGTYSERQAYVEERFRFTCSCRQCSLPLIERKTSDARRVRMQNLQLPINPIGFAISPEESLASCHGLLQLAEEEFDVCAGPFYDKLYNDSLLMCIGHGDQARASAFAEQAYKARVISEGEDSQSALRMKGFAVKPTDHFAYRKFSMSWKTTIGMVPKGLDTTQFRKWLFRA